jgi:hypothetical protein
MVLQFGISRPYAKSRVSGKGDEGETFVEEYWEGGVTEEYEKLKYNKDLNPGQLGILDSEEEGILDYLYEVEEDYNIVEFLEFLQTSLKDDGRYEALSETFNNYAIAVEDVWDHASGGDGQKEKKFLGMHFS